MHMQENARGNTIPGEQVEAVKRMATFFDIFDRPLRKADFEKYLHDSGFKDSNLNGIMEIVPWIESDGEFFYLKGRNNVVGRYIDNRKWLLEYREKARKYAKLFRYLPFVDGVAICNNLSFESVDEDSDIDLFVITSKERIFTARIVSALLFHFLGIRRHGKRIRGRFCLSFYVAGNDFKMKDIALENEDIYLHFWGRCLVPIYGKNVVYQLLHNNRDFLNLVNGAIRDTLDDKPGFFKIIVERLLAGGVGDYAENRLEKWHLGRLAGVTAKTGMNPGLIVNQNILKFHNRDRRKEYAEAFWERYRKINDD